MRSFTQHEASGITLGAKWPIPRPKPIVYFVEPSSLCNAACIFCHYPQMRDSGKTTDVADDTVLLKSIALLEQDARQRELENIGVSLTPTTGDILINKNWLTFAKIMLAFPFVGWLDIVTNGILLTKNNIEALCSLIPLEKLDFSVSVGGVDRETYEFMFGTDMFIKVQRNILTLFDYLIANDIKLNVTIRLRVPDASKISNEDIIKTFNPNKYQWASYEILDTYKDVPIDVPGKESLKIYNEIRERSNDPCGMLKIGSFNFNANGEITACGCHYSQMPNDKSLLLGHVNTVTLKELTHRREKHIDNWQRRNLIPKPCQTCQHYHQHDGALQNKILLKEPKDDSRFKNLFKRFCSRKKGA